MGQNNSSKNKKINIVDNIDDNSLNKGGQIIIGIDFGSCGITFAYAFLDDPKKEIYSAKSRKK